MKKIIFIYLFFNFLNSYSQDGTIDNTFNVGTGFNKPIYAIAVQSDNKILIGGSFTTYNNINSNCIIRLNSDGSIDNSFIVGNGFGEYSTVLEITIQDDGKILVGGNFASYNGTYSQKIIRLNSNGTVDNSFVGLGLYMGFEPGSKVSVIKIQPNGKILVGGDFTSYNQVTANKIIRLNSDGSKDNSFAGTGFNSSVSDISLQTDGKIIVSGNFQTYSSLQAQRIIRLNSNGTKDLTFDPGSSFSNGIINAGSIKIQSNGKIVVGGQFSTYQSITSNRIVRINNDGIIDNSFITGTGFAIPSIVSNVDLQSDNKILIGGYFSSFNNNSTNLFTRLNPDGSIDNTFNSNGTGFNTVTVNSTVSEICQQSDGKILLGGSFTSYNGVNYNNIIRLNNPSNVLGNKDYEFEKLSIYPNPTLDILKFSVFVNKIEITDLTGKIVLNKNNSNFVNLVNLQKGIYLVSITNKDGIKVHKKIIKN